MAPDAATCAIVAATLVPLAGQESARYISLSMVLAVLAGVFCIDGGLARLGFLTNFLARPILTGYLNGIAISIISGQLGKLFGFSVEPGGFFRMMADSFQSWTRRTRSRSRRDRPPSPSFFWRSVSCPESCASDCGRPWDRGRVGFRPRRARGRARGHDSRGASGTIVPSIHASDIGPLALGAVGLALISFNSAMVTARSFAVKNRNEIDRIRSSSRSARRTSARGCCRASPSVGRTRAPR